MNLSPKAIASLVGVGVALLALIAWFTGDKSDPDKTKDELAFLEDPNAEAPFLDDYSAPPVIHDPVPEVEPTPEVESPTAKSPNEPETESDQGIVVRPKTQPAAQPSPGPSPKEPERALPKVAQNKPSSPRPPHKTAQPDDLPTDRASAAVKPKTTFKLPSKKSPPKVASSPVRKPAAEPSIPAKKTTPSPAPPKAVTIHPKAEPIPPKAEAVPPKAIAVEEQPPAAKPRAQRKPAIQIAMVQPKHAAATDRSNVLKQSRYLVSTQQLNTFLKTHGLPARAVTDDSNIALATHEEAVAFTAWLTLEHRRTGIISTQQHYRLPTTSETRSTQIWRHDDNPAHDNVTRPLGLVLARGAKP